MTSQEILLTLAFAVVSALYGAIGHGGASGYLAVMGLAGTASSTMRPTALVLNLIVSLTGALLFHRHGWLRLRLLLPFAIGSVPMAFLGGGLVAAPGPYRIVLACTLAVAAWRLLAGAPNAAGESRPPSWMIGIMVGAAIGFVSGWIGVGGGIFLTPIVLFCRWGDVKAAAAVSAPFIFVNSAAGLIGAGQSLAHLPPSWPWFALAVLVGGWIGSRWGSGKATPRSLRAVLASVLAAACVKLVLPVG